MYAAVNYPYNPNNVYNYNASLRGLTGGYWLLGGILAVMVYLGTTNRKLL